MHNYHQSKAAKVSKNKFFHNICIYSIAFLGSIGNYVIDFICREKLLVIEVDGGQHADNKKDEERDAWLKSEGFKVLRFWNNEALTNMKGVLEVIRENCLNHPPLNPLPQGRGNK